MRILIAIPVYDVNGAREELAKRTGWYKKYSRQRIDELIKKMKPAPEKIGRRYFLTEAQLSWLAEELQTNKRRKDYRHKTTDKI